MQITRRLIGVSVLRLFCALGIAGCAMTNMEKGQPTMQRQPLTSEEVVQFLQRFDELADKEDFDPLEPLVHERAVFRFNDGDFTGRAAIRAVFEKTWRGTPGVKKARFYASDVVVLSTDLNSATATYTYNWEGSQDGRAFRVQGRGTRVVVRENGRLQIIHEHLSRFPKAP
jgi:ketosteroid isomerase-like protein